MRSRTCVSKALLLIVIAVSALSFSCKKNQPQQADAGFGYDASVNPEVISAHTYGQNTMETSISFSFVRSIVTAEKIGSEVAGCSIEPHASGKFRWANESTVTFVPDKPLARGVEYRVKFTPSLVHESLVEYTEEMYFSFSVINLNTSISLDYDYSYPIKDDITAVQMGGNVSTSDVIEPESMEKDLTVTLDGKKVSVTWTHAKFYHSFVIGGIKKHSKNNQEIVVQYRGYDKGKRNSETISRTIPRLENVLQVTECTAIENSERYLLIRFSSPLLESQDFSGYVSITPTRKLRYAVDGAQLMVYSLDGWPDTAKVRVSEGLRDRGAASIQAVFEKDVSFTSEAPGLRFVDSGVIVPNVGIATIPIDTVNLTGVIVTIEKVYEQNLGQFLQVNELDGNNEMHRVGKQIWKKIVPIDFEETDRNKWTRTNLDLSPILADGSHDLYRISVSCDVRMSAYPGAAQLTETELLQHNLERLELSRTSSLIRILGESFWTDYKHEGRRRRYNEEGESYSGAAFANHFSYFDRNYYYYYSRSERANPVSAARNVLVSNIGLVVQSDVTNRLVVAVTRLTDAQPVKGAKVSVRNYQNREIASGQTDSAGLATFEGVQDEYLVVAETESDKGYLSLQGKSNQPVSHFDVSGQAIQQGVKGYIYGERGVWRPGDPIYLTFVLKDTNGVLPPNHPAVLTFYDPQGRYRQTVRNASPVGNFYSFQLRTGASDITGTYTARIEVGGLSFTKPIQVETIKPNRLKIEFKIDGDPAKLGTSSVRARIHSSWLHGSDASGLKADVNARMVSVPTKFAGYEDYTFDYPIVEFNGEANEVYSGRLDGEGNADFELGLSANAIAPGKLNAFIKTRVYEEGGNMNTDSFSIPFDPYDQYVGVAVASTNPNDGWSPSYPGLDITKKNPVRIALVDSSGKPVKSGRVDLAIYRIGWRWWWERHTENIANYLGTADYSLLTSKSVDVENGAATWNLDLSDKDELWGRYLIRARDSKTGHTTGSIVYFYYPGWYYRSAEQKSESPAMLNFTADKPRYSPGETASVSIPSSENAQILVSIENNGKLVKSELIPAAKGTTTYKLKITGDMVPNVYVHATQIQPYGQTGNDRPIRLYGVIPLEVNDSETVLSPTIESAASFEPKGKATVTVGEKNGRAMTYTLAIVDEGLLNITRFGTPNPWTHFFQRDALAVRTFDLYGFVSQNSDSPAARMLAIGGGEDVAGSESQKANRFPPMVKYMGPFALDAGKTASHEIQLPQYVGAVRLMVVAGNDKSFGSVEKTVPVKKAIMTYTVLPRVLSIGETLNLPITVFALEKGIKSVKVKVSVSGPLKIEDASEQTLAFEKTGDQLATFSLTALGRAGPAKVSVTSSSGNEVFQETIEIDVRVPSPPETKVFSAFLSPNEKGAIPFEYAGVPGTNDLKIEYSSIEPIDFGRRLDYLIHYPYGCVEQTTSSVFPQLYLDQITDLSPDVVSRIRTNVQAGINRLIGFQVHGGGLSYWPGGNGLSDYGTVYASHFILEAEALGYSVPSSFKANLVKGLKQIAQGSSGADSSYDLMRAYALYDLALAGSPEIGLMNRLREKTTLQATGKFKLAGAYALIGQKEAALKLLDKANVQSTGYVELDGSFGTDIRDMAMLVEAFTSSDMVDRAVPLIARISKSLSSESWYGTQSTAYSLLALGKFLKAYSLGQGDEPLSLAYSWEGAKKSSETGKRLGTFGLEASPTDKEGKFACQNTSKVPLYVRVISSGLPEPMSIDKTSNRLSIDVRWTDKSGNSIDIENLRQGTDLVADITVKNLENYYLQNIALETIMPCGFEITNPRFEGWENPYDSEFTYQDVRDDRIYTFFNMNYRDNGTKRFRFLVTATYVGKFYLPSFKVAAMYDDSFKATTGAKWITISADAP
jgi:alpha-2-macroglobulin